LEKIRRQTTYCSLLRLSLSTFIKLFKLSRNSEHCTENVAHTLPDVAQSSEPKPKAVRSINNIVIECYPKAVFRNKMHQNCIHFRLRLHPEPRLESYDPPRTSCSRLEGVLPPHFPSPSTRSASRCPVRFFKYDDLAALVKWLNVTFFNAKH